MNSSLNYEAARQSTLKIFMAPEFFFRGENGAYSLDLVMEIIPKLQKQGDAQLGTKGAHYADWLFVFGTAVAAVPTEDGNVAEVQNVALVQKDATIAVVQKEYVSNIDYTGNKVGPTPPTSGSAWQRAERAVVPSRGARPQPGFAAQEHFVTQNDERLSGVRLTIDEIRIGLEVCLDHLQQRAASLAHSTQILLIPSYGMKIEHKNCVDGGVIFNVDGRGNGNSSVEVKGQGPKQKVDSYDPKIRGTIEVFGPFDIPY
jgi:hypothetical protein